MAAVLIDVSASQLWYGTETEILALTPTSGLVGFATDTQTEYTGNGVAWIKTRQGTAGAAHVLDPSLTFITYAGSGFTYYCEAVPASGRSDSVWRVSRKTDATGDIIYAGTGIFDQVADDLAAVAGLTYTLGA